MSHVEGAPPFWNRGSLGACRVVKKSLTAEVGPGQPGLMRREEGSLGRRVRWEVRGKEPPPHSLFHIHFPPFSSPRLLSPQTVADPVSAEKLRTPSGTNVLRRLFLSSSVYLPPTPAPDVVKPQHKHFLSCYLYFIRESVCLMSSCAGNLLHVLATLGRAPSRRCLWPQPGTEEGAVFIYVCMFIHF